MDLGELGSYAYSGHSVLVGKKMRAWQDRDYVLRYFAQRDKEAAREYISFVSKGVEEGRRPDLVGGGLLRCVGGWKGLKELRDSGERVRADERILGGSEFVERVLRECEEEWERRSLLKQRGISLDQLLDEVAEYFGVAAGDVRCGSKVRAVVKARAVLCYVGVRKLGLTSVSVAKELAISPSAVSKLIGRGQQMPGREAIEKCLLKSQ
jgi:hypothetical protein